MYEILWMVPAFPFLGFLVLVATGSKLHKRLIAFVGAGSVAMSAVVAGLIGFKFIVAPPPGNRFNQTLWNWMDVAGFHPTFGLHLDALSVVMIFVVTFVGFLIHVYSTEYMGEDEGYARFFAYLNLFMSAMLVLVLADNLLMLYLGWEGVGLCSYLLIGFWHKAPENARAAIKAFVVTRIGDTAFAVGLFLIFTNLGTINIQEILEKAPQAWAPGSTLATAAALLLLGGALGKSAQLPLQTWLPDAMAGPTPVSALIHAATMVTAGVYLIARMNALYTLAPVAQTLVAIIGALTLFMAACSALTQTDIKRALAYSTISQVGYMFLALGVGAWSAAIFHFANHAFFKALLFLAAGAIINSVHHEQNMFKMGGLRKQTPFVFWVFLIGASSLASLPLVTSGFYSKDLILWYSMGVAERQFLALVAGGRRSRDHRPVLFPNGISRVLRRTENHHALSAGPRNQDTAAHSGNFVGGFRLHSNAGSVKRRAVLLEIHTTGFACRADRLQPCSGDDTNTPGRRRNSRWSYCGLRGLHQRPQPAYSRHPG